jgi:hypothetical protein
MPASEQAKAIVRAALLRDRERAQATQQAAKTEADANMAVAADFPQDSADRAYLLRKGNRKAKTAIRAQNTVPVVDNILGALSE